MAKAKKKASSFIPDETIMRKIFFIRQQKVMLDYDLATLYEVETKALNQAVKRNIERFPQHYMFRLTKKEWQTMRSQFVTTSPQSIELKGHTTMRSQIVTASQRKRNTAITPYAFTEHGVAMLSGVLKSSKAVKMSIAVVDAFIALKKFVIDYKDLTEQLDAVKAQLGKHDVQLDGIYRAIEILVNDKKEREDWEDRKRIGFKSE